MRSGEMNHNINRLTEIIAEKLNRKLKGKLEWDIICKVFRITTDKVFVVIKNSNSDWYNFPNKRENLICASSIESFDKWGRCMYMQECPVNDKNIERIIKNIERLSTPLYVEMSNNGYDGLDNDEIETIYKVANEEKDFYSDILKSCDTIQHNEYIKILYQHMENCVQDIKDTFNIEFDYELVCNYDKLDNSTNYEIQHNCKFIDRLEKSDTDDNEKLFLVDAKCQYL
jgi:hypothetical protein